MTGDAACGLARAEARMGPDDEICLCFHVTQRKVLSFLRREKPRRVGQLSDCLGAGTGCGWCRPYLEQLFQGEAAGLPPSADLTPEEYANGRARFIEKGERTR